MDNCSACRFWNPVSLYEWGTCRRYAPRPAQSGEGRALPATWPTTAPGNWCDEWEQRSAEQIALDREVEEAVNLNSNVEWPEGLR